MSSMSGSASEVVGEVVLVFEFLLVFDGVAGDAEDDDAGLLEFFEGVAEAAGLDGAAGGVGAGVEEEDYGGVFVVGEVDGLAVLVLEGEVFYDVVGLHGGLSRVCMGVSPPPCLRSKVFDSGRLGPDFSLECAAKVFYSDTLDVKYLNSVAYG